MYPFLKGHGTENDFVLLPDHDGTVHGGLSPEAWSARVRALYTSTMRSKRCHTSKSWRIDRNGAMPVPLPSSHRSRPSTKRSSVR